MLKKAHLKHCFYGVYTCVSILLLYAAYSNELFGDEAFYWLEGQWLDWSYSEVPGWTPWTLAVAEWLFPHHHFFLRIPNLLAALSLPWLAILLASSLGANSPQKWTVGLLMMSLPLIGMAGGLAIPDIWLIVFTVLSTWLLVKAIDSNQILYYTWLGCALAIGINIHLRFWIIIFITCWVFLWCYRTQKQTIKRLLLVTLPWLIVGLLPIIIFNLQHDFPLLAFQLQDRHPWTFQASHLSFLPVQVLVTTPLVFWLCLTTLTTQHNGPNPNYKTAIVYAALLHWLFYALVGFFSDNLRLNIHWTLSSYVLLLVIAAVSSHPSEKFKQWAWISGVLANVAVTLTLLYWLHHQQPISSTNARITNNSVGWQGLANKTDAWLTREGQDQVLVDHFMTLATLKYYSKHANSITTLPHQLNQKHGRSTQLQLMGLMAQKHPDPQLLVVEQTALKLTAAIGYYQSLCEQLNGLELVDVFNYKDGLKTYHFFRTQAGTCQIPPLTYQQVDDKQITGWVLEHKQHPVTITPAVDLNPSNIPLTIVRTPLGGNELFATLPPDQYQLVSYSMPQEVNHGLIQLKIEWLGHTTFSPIFVD